MEGIEQGCGDSRQHGHPKSKSISSTRCTARDVRQLDQLVDALGKDGDCPDENIATGLLEKSRRGIVDGLRKFTAVDNHEAVKVVGLHQDTKSFRVVKPKFTTDFPGAAIREGADELSHCNATTRRRCIAHLHRHHEGRCSEMAASAGRRGLACLFARLFSRELKDKNGKPCVTTTRTCTWL